MFDSLQIKGFRAFGNLEIQDLGLVNLVVGKNNVGKTTVLEALKLRCAGTTAAWELRTVLAARQEIDREYSEGAPPAMWNLDRLFHEGQSKSLRPVLSIGAIDTPVDTLTLELALVRTVEDSAGEITRLIVEDVPSDSESADLAHGIALRFGEGPRRIFSPERILRLRSARPVVGESELGVINCNFLPARGFVSETAELWDRVVLTDMETDVLDALRIVAPDLERISMVESKAGRGERVALVRRKGSEVPEPLRSMGDGMNRIFDMALGLATSKSGVFLVDEIENGVHYSVQEELWKFIFEIASRTQTQVFATTHSWDCIEAFQKVSSSHSAKGSLVRLYRQADDIHTKVFNETRLSILTRQSIEVR